MSQTNYSLYCKADNVKEIHTLLQCVHDNKKDQIARVEIQAAGVVFTVSTKTKNVQASVTLKDQLFETYETDQDLTPENSSFSISLYTLLECLMIFGLSALQTVRAGAARSTAL